MIRYWFWLACFRVGWWWLVVTGRKNKEAPEWFERAYNRQAHAWNKRQWRKK